VIFGGTLFYSLRNLMRLSLMLCWLNMYFSYLKFDATVQQFSTRQLSNDVNGMVTFFRPDELVTRVNSLWLIVVQVAIILVTTQVWHRSKSFLQTDFGNPR
jgi:hypothetical protein